MKKVRTASPDAIRRIERADAARKLSVDLIDRLTELMDLTHKAPASEDALDTILRRLESAKSLAERVHDAI